MKTKYLIGAILLGILFILTITHIYIYGYFVTMLLFFLFCLSMYFLTTDKKVKV